MQYKTRGMSNPQGKARVYFCCHPQDFEVYFDSVSDEILNTQNCAIWYDTSDVPLDEECQLDLEQMQLFVMPVTTKLLTTPNRALSDIFPFAIKNHTPVLPIMMEGGLEELFSKKCGDLQFLDKTAHDSTAISYEEKLEKYLSSILVGDELAAKVRAAFDAYIFLSYRKKDRKYAQELMRLIHQNDFCRDVAIWYDEYLIPGENFNTAIEDMLLRSDLFALAVTKNLLENPNYVLTQEYPKAKIAQKPILPIEATPTDADALGETYPGIPDCVHKEDQQELSAALHDSLKHIAFRENDSDPQHNFFIGLAYLNGIDVEVDHALARKLITEAAETGLPEAIEKLVEMYRTGTGVGWDYHEAIRWQEKLVDLRRTDYEQDNSEKNGHQLVSELCLLGDYENELRNLTTAESVYQQMLEVSLETVGSYKTVQVRRDLSISYERLGNICQAEGNLAQAKEYYQKSLELCSWLAKETGTLETRRDLSICYDNLGVICEAEGNLTQAREYYQKSLELRCQHTKITGASWVQKDLAISYGKLGGVYQAQSEFSQAGKYYEKSLEFAKRYAWQTGLISAKRDVAGYYNSLGDFYLYMGNHSAALRFFEMSLDLNKELKKESEGILQTWRNIAYSYNKMGSICQAEDGFSQARIFFKKELEFRRQLWEVIGDLNTKIDLESNYYRIVVSYRAEGNHSKAEVYDKKLREFMRWCGAGTTSIETRRDLTANCEMQGKEFHNWTILEQAKAYYEKSIELHHHIPKDKKIINVWRDMSDYRCWGDDCYFLGNYNRAKKYYVKSLELSRQLVWQAETIDALWDLKISYEKLGNVCRTQCNHIEAKEFYEKSLTLTFQLAREKGTLWACNALAVAYYNVISVSEVRHTRNALIYKILLLLSQRCQKSLVFAQYLSFTKKFLVHD